MSTTQFIAVEGTRRIAYDVLKSTQSAAPASSSKTFVLSTSLGDIRQEYRYLAKMLHNEGENTVISLDLRGMGESDVKFSSYTPMDTGDDIVKVMKSLPYDRYVLVGCSMTAASVVHAASELPGRIEAVILISAFLWDHDMPFGVLTLLSVLLNRWIGPSFWSSYYASLYTLPNAPVADLKDHCRALKANLRQPGRIAALRGQLFGLKDPCAKKSKILVELNIPVFAMYGTSDPDFAGAGVQKEADEMQKYFPHMRIPPLLIPGAGHYPQVEIPDTVNTAIQDFLKSV